MSPKSLASGVIAAIVMGFVPGIAAAKDVIMTPEQLQKLEIKVEPVRPATFEPVALLAGTVVPPMNSRIVAAAPYAGTVIQVHVLPGQRVKKGEPLAVVSSRDLLEAQSLLAQSEAELQMADAIARRKRNLADKNFQSPTVAEEAEAQVAKIRAVIERHKRTSSLNGITILENGHYTIPAPSDGRIVESRVMPGDSIETMAAAITIDTSEDLWVDVQVPANTVARIKVGDSVQIVNGPTGRVVSIGGTLDAMTRSAVMMVSVPANSGLMTGQMVTVILQRTTETGNLNVPSTAVARIDNEHAVFVRNDAGFTVVRVELRGRSPELATVSGDIATGAEVASSGLPQLEQMLAGE